MCIQVPVNKLTFMHFLVHSDLLEKVNCFFKYDDSRSHTEGVLLTFTLIESASFDIYLKKSLTPFED